MTKKMKKINVITFAVLALAFIFTSIGISFSSKMNAKAEEYPAYSSSVYAENIARPFWKSNVIFNETVLITLNDDSSVSGKLLYPAVKVLSVTNHDGTVSYTEGVDFTVSGNTITAIENRLPYLHNVLTKGLIDGATEKSWSDYSSGGGYYNNGSWQGNGMMDYGYCTYEGAVYTEGYLFRTNYIQVTYVYDPAAVNTSYLTTHDASYFGGLREKLEAGQDITMVSIGDSITAGCSSTGEMLNVAPYQPGYVTLVKNEIERLYGVNVTLIKLAVGGTQSDYLLEGQAGRNSFVNALNNYDFDLAIIAYGMNDQGGLRSGASFQSNVQATVNELVADSPNCNIVFLNTFPRNPAMDRYSGSVAARLQRYADYKNALDNVSSGLNTSKGANVSRVIDMYPIGTYFMSNAGKPYAAISSSNCNHPNDSFHRVYAMQVVSALHDYEYKSYQEIFNMQTTVTFDANGGSAVDAQTIKYNSVATEPNAPVRDGYIFDGWYLNGAEFDFATTVTNDITLVAKWTADDGTTPSETKWTVTFDYNDGETANGTEEVSDGLTATKPADPTRENYTFEGWLLNGKPYEFVKIVTEDITLVAKWKAASTEVRDMFTVTFDTNGGSEIAPVILYEGDKVDKPLTPSKTGHIFLGWLLNGTEYDFNSAVTGDITLVANWEKPFALADYFDKVEVTSSKTEIIPAAPHHHTAWKAALIDFGRRMPSVDKYVDGLGGWNAINFMNVDNNTAVKFTSSTGEDKLQGISIRENFIFVWPKDANGFAKGDIITIEAGTTWEGYQIKQTLVYTCQGLDMPFTLSEASIQYKNVYLNNVYLYNDLVWGAPTIELDVALPAGTQITQLQNFRTTMNMEYVKAAGGNGNLADCSFTANNRFLVRLADDLNANNKYYAANGDKFIIKAGSYITVGLTAYRFEQDVVYVVTNAGATSQNGGMGLSEYKQYTVTFDPNGGVLNGDATQSVYTGEKVTAPADPTREATEEYVYTFNGWKLNDFAYDFNANVTGNITLVADWIATKKTYTVTFDPNGGTLTDNATVELEYGSYINVSNPTKAATAEYTYTFNGWKLNGEAYDFTSTVTGDITLVADWIATKNTYTVTFDSNGGTAVESQTVEYGLTFAEPVAPTKDGYTFAGWTLDGDEYFFDTLVTENITLVAVWEEIPAPEDKGGCGSSISIAGLGISAALTLIGGAVIVSKKKSK